MARTALFVIDIQADLAQDPQTEIPHAARIRDVGAAILSKARIAIDNELGRGLGANLSIIIVQHHETPENGVLVRGSKSWELVFKPRNKTERIVEKTTSELKLDRLLQYNPDLLFYNRKWCPGHLLYLYRGHVRVQPATRRSAKSGRG